MAHKTHFGFASPQQCVQACTHSAALMGSEQPPAAAIDGQSSCKSSQGLAGASCGGHTAIAAGVSSPHDRDAESLKAARQLWHAEKVAAAARDVEGRIVVLGKMIITHVAVETIVDD
eukprot:scaffold215133_cov39-Tisochrysis_lutea.AAC.4